jgi:hypothetical protein
MSQHKYIDYPMVQIPAGQVELRDDRKKRTWTVELNAYLLAPVPVTQELYNFIGAADGESSIA